MRGPKNRTTSTCLDLQSYGQCQNDDSIPGDSIDDRGEMQLELKSARSIISYSDFVFKPSCLPHIVFIFTTTSLHFYLPSLHQSPQAYRFDQLLLQPKTYFRSLYPLQNEVCNHRPHSHRTLRLRLCRGKPN